ncbi:MAG: V-type ATP synthase subunit D [Erysipelotrichaceae bacterium]|nr:V-type ATP synthase subunit D [Erysipelotrichaceae bacterium]MDY6034407.1 V-type ATP synthase subunit D [Bulleidia sp.]
MPSQLVATKGNLIKARKSLALAQNGFELMDRKRNILIREMMSQVEKVKILREQITSAYQTGYYLLQQANMSSGMISSITEQIKVDDSIRVTYRSVMGVEVPNIIYTKPDNISVPYGLEGTSSRIDEAYIQFQKVKEITLILAEVDNSIYRLANAISKTQKRANALKNVVIPRYQTSIKDMSESLEEKEREEFSRMKVIKAQKSKQVEHD